MAEFAETTVKTVNCPDCKRSLLATKWPRRPGSVKKLA